MEALITSEPFTTWLTGEKGFTADDLIAFNNSFVPRLAKERRMRSSVHRVLKEDLGEKVTEAEWTLLWLAAETKVRLDGMTAKQRHRKTGMRLQMGTW